MMRPATRNFVQQLPRAAHLLEVRALVVYGCQRELVLDAVRELAVVGHQLFVVALALGGVEQDARLQGALGALGEGGGQGAAMRQQREKGV